MDTVSTASRRRVGRSNARTNASPNSSTSRTTSEYIRVSLPYRIAYGEHANSNRAAVPTRPGVAPSPLPNIAATRPTRRPAIQATGRVISDRMPDSARTATSPVPNNLIHMCRSR